MNAHRLLVGMTAVAGLAFAAAPVVAQDTATTNGSASVTVVVPISLTKTADLNFGAVTAVATPSVVTIAANGARTGDANVLIGGGSPAAASFTVAGDADRAFTFTLPAGAATLTSGVDTMTVDTWTSDAPATVTGGSVPVNVGGNLNLGAAQAAGDYTGTFAVTVTYD